MLLNVSPGPATRRGHADCSPTTTRPRQAATAHPRCDRDLRALLAGRRRGPARRARADGRRYRLTVDLPPDFALNQELSTFALAALELLDPASETFALDVVSVLEATLEDPRQVLTAQLSKARGEAVAQMKAEGIEYEERIELLDEVTYPRPLAELLEHAFTVYVRANPWVADVAAVAEVRRARHVGAGDDVPRVRRDLRADPLGGGGAAVPVRRVQGAAVGCAGRGQDRRGGRHRRMARRARAAGGLAAAGRVGAAHLARQPTRSP